MAHLHNYRNKKTTFVDQSTGSKSFCHAARFAAEAKGLWDLGKGIYQTAQSIGPYIGAAAPALALL